VVRRALVVLAAAGALPGPAAAEVPPIVFSGTGPPDLVAPHRYEIRLDRSGRASCRCRTAAFRPTAASSHAWRAQTTPGPSR
jgi:hypothetical protein